MRPTTRALLAELVSIGCDGGSECGPSQARVARIIDGDTIELVSGQRIRYILVNTPETTSGKNECFGANAVQLNTDLVLGKTVQLEYDVECTDGFDRTLAYVSVSGHEVNRLMIERGYACVLHISPNGDERVNEFDALETAAKHAGRGLWGVCDPVPCD